MRKLTKIIATLSDKRCDPAFISALYQAGMNVARVNTAHQSLESTGSLIANVRAVSNNIAIMLDTKGPEIRTSPNGSTLNVSKDDLLKVRGGSGVSAPGNLFVSLENITSMLTKGNVMMIDDGDLALEVIDKQDDYLVCQVMNSGEIKTRKSVNLPGVKVNLPSLTKRDIEFIELAIREDVEFLAHSFVRNASDVQAIQQILDSRKSNVKIIAKIENQEGVDNIDTILPHVYGIMVARGDLAIEIPAEKVPVIQNDLIDKCIKKRKIVIVATQMLHSMITSPRPTRAEVNDVANAVLSGVDAVMLSGETAYGEYALESVQMMSRIATATEQSHQSRESHEIEPHDNEVSGFLAITAVRASMQLNVKAVIADTDTGKTARYLAAFRGRCPVYAQCYQNRVMRELAMNFGVYADQIDVATSKKVFTKAVLNKLMATGDLNQEDLVVVLAGNFGKKVGPSFVEVSRVKNLITA